jgi:hypothetical protein
VLDVSLAEGGVLLGQVLDPQGAPQANMPVTIAADGKAIGVARTDVQGYFAFRGLRGGTYGLTAAEGRGLYRAWVAGTAPPGARPGAIVVAGEDLVRGQWGAARFWLTDPWVLTGLGLAAIAVPAGIILADDDDEPESP